MRRADVSWGGAVPALSARTPECPGGVGRAESHPGGHETGLSLLAGLVLHELGWESLQVGQGVRSLVDPTALRDSAA